MNTVPTGSGSGSATLIVRLNKLALDPDPFMQIISGQSDSDSQPCFKKYLYLFGQI
jgi:hypothetical protein